MRMTEDNDIRAKLSDHLLIARFELVELAEDVTNQNTAPGKLLNPLVWQGQGWVVVATHGKDRRDGLQSFNHIKLAYIAGVNDCIHSVKDGRYRLIEEPVGV